MNKAKEQGVYKNFSGSIEWKYTNCQVRNADFEIFPNDDDFNEIIFNDVVFVSGKIIRARIFDGLNLGCRIEKSTIYYLYNKGGEIINCTWLDGIFEGGLFEDSSWLYGVWTDGKWVGYNCDRDGKMQKDSPDKWEKN